MNVCGASRMNATHRMRKAMVMPIWEAQRFVNSVTGFRAARSRGVGTGRGAHACASSPMGRARPGIWVRSAWNVPVDATSRMMSMSSLSE